MGARLIGNFDKRDAGGDGRKQQVAHARGMVHDTDSINLAAGL
jgi:hypothetical protein